MNDAELAGGVLADASDPVASARELQGLLTKPGSTEAVRDLGLEAALVDVLRQQLGSDEQRIQQACREGAAWALGRCSVTRSAHWELVATRPTGIPAPTGLRRGTGETLLHLAARAHRRIRLAAPFMDETGLTFLREAIVGATQRGVTVEIFAPTRGAHAQAPLQALSERVAQEGNPSRLRMTSMRFGAPWAHLKVMTRDGLSAYVGSANMTRPGLFGANLELGVIVQGDQVRVIDELLDAFQDGCWRKLAGHGVG